MKIKVHILNRVQTTVTDCIEIPPTDTNCLNISICVAHQPAVEGKTVHIHFLLTY